MTFRHKGAEWIQSALKPKSPMSPIGIAVANLLGEVFAGIHHLDERQLRKVDWADDYVVVVELSHRSLSTYDSDHLTRLVVVAHDCCLRVDVAGSGKHKLELMFHQRKREGLISERMPTMEEHMAYMRRLDVVEVEHARPA